MQFDTTILHFKAKKTTHKEHVAKMRELRYFYNRGWISQAEALIQFLDHLEMTTGVRPYKKPFPYKNEETKQTFIRPLGAIA